MEPVGSGTSAIVYKAIDKTFNTIFAVKEYKKVQVTLSSQQIHLTSLDVDFLIISMSG